MSTASNEASRTLNTTAEAGKGETCSFNLLRLQFAMKGKQKEPNRSTRTFRAFLSMALGPSCPRSGLTSLPKEETQVLRLMSW